MSRHPLTSLVTRRARTTSSLVPMKWEGAGEQKGEEEEDGEEVEEELWDVMGGKEGSGFSSHDMSGDSGNKR